MKICAVQLWNWFGIHDDRDARRIASELSSRKLANGRLVVGAYMHKGKNWKLRSAEAKRLGCDYVVEVWPHDVTTAGGFAQGRGSGLLASPPDWVTGEETLNFRMIRTGEKRVIATGTTNLVFDGPWHVGIPSWDERLASDIVAKLNAMEP